MRISAGVVRVILDCVNNSKLDWFTLSISRKSAAKYTTEKVPLLVAKAKARAFLMKEMKNGKEIQGFMAKNCSKRKY